MRFKDFDEYQKITKKSAVYPSMGKNLVFPVLGLAGESGEVSDKVKKIIRDSNFKITKEDRKEIAKELGDALWYLSQISLELNLKLSEVVKINLEKISSRHQRNKVHGSGDNR